MYCKKCYTNLENSFEMSRCPKCRRFFDANNPATFFARPFPDRSRIIFRIVATTILGIIAAFIVAAFQMAVAIPPISGGH